MRKILVYSLALTVCQAINLFGQSVDHDTAIGSLEALLETRISTAAKYSQTTSEAPASVTIITAEDISDYGYETLDDILMNVRGFYTSNDRNYTYIGVRGFSRPTDYNNRILLLMNGHTINDNVYGSAPFGTEMAMDLGIVDRIEIVRGPGSALYGTGAMFAVINIITKKGDMVDGLMASGKVGSYGKVVGCLTYGKELKNGLDIMISGMKGDIEGQSLYYADYDDPSTNNGMANDLDEDRYFGLITTISYRSFKFQGVGLSREKEVPTGAWNVAFNAKPSKTLDQWNHLEFKYDGPVTPNKNILLRGYFSHYYYKGWLPYDVIQYDASIGKQLGGEGQFRWDFRTSNTLTMGIEYQRNSHVDYKYWNADTVYFDKNIPFDVLSLYCQDEYQITENLSLTFGLRHDRYSDADNSTAPRGAIVYSPVKSGTLKLLYGEAYRKPNFYEANYDDRFSGYKANPGLGPEKIGTLELVWEQRLAKNFLGVISLYSYRMKDLIDQEIDPADSLIQYQNVNHVRATGLELGFDARLQSGVSGYTNYIYQEAKDSKLGTWLSNSPSHMFKAGLSYPLKPNFHAGGEFIYESSRLTIRETRTAPFFLVGLNLRFTPRFSEYSEWERLANMMEMSFQVNNLFNVSYEMPAGFEHRQTSIVQNGRNFVLKMGIKL